jgi:hypothetical protein
VGLPVCRFVEGASVTVCKGCGHPYGEHIFGGMCRLCDCRRCVYETTPEPIRREPEPEAPAEAGVVTLPA